MLSDGHNKNIGDVVKTHTYFPFKSAYSNKNLHEENFIDFVYISKGQTFLVIENCSKTDKSKGYKILYDINKKHFVKFHQIFVHKVTTMKQ